MDQDGERDGAQTSWRTRGGELVSVVVGVHRVRERLRGSAAGAEEVPGVSRPT